LNEQNFVYYYYYVDGTMIHQKAGGQVDEIQNFPTNVLLMSGRKFEDPDERSEIGRSLL
jgi:hypothetical protein